MPKPQKSHLEAVPDHRSQTWKIWLIHTDHTSILMADNLDFQAMRKRRTRIAKAQGVPECAEYQ